jgi:hypothetical protein
MWAIPVQCRVRRKRKHRRAWPRRRFHWTRDASGDFCRRRRLQLLRPEACGQVTSQHDRDGQGSTGSPDQTFAECRWCQQLIGGVESASQLPTREELTSTCRGDHHRRTQPHFLHIVCNRAGHCRTSIYAPDTRRTLLLLVFVQRLSKSDWAWWSFAVFMEAHLGTAYLDVAEVDEREMYRVDYFDLQLQCGRIWSA